MLAKVPSLLVETPQGGAAHRAYIGAVTPCLLSFLLGG